MFSPPAWRITTIRSTHRLASVVLLPSESTQIIVVMHAAAVRAREVSHDPARRFVNLVRQRLGENITQTQENRARLTLVRFRELRPEGFRPQISSLSTMVADLY